MKEERRERRRKEGKEGVRKGNGRETRGYE